MTSSLDIAQDGNLFPREDLAHAVAASDWRDQPVPALAWLLAAAGLAAMAAGTPIVDTVIMAPTESAARAHGPWALCVHGAARAMGAMGLETAFFLLSALLSGGAFLAVGGALRAFGFRGRLAFAVSALAVSAPLVLTHGRLASDFTAGATGAALLLMCTKRALDLEAPRRWALAGLGLVLWAVFSSVRLGASAEPLHSRAVDLMGLGALWLAVPMSLWRSHEEELPPLWLGLWLGSVLAFVVAAPEAGADGTPLLVAPLAVLFAGVLARFARPESAARAAGAALLIHALLLAVVRAPATTDSALARHRGDTRAGDAVLIGPGTPRQLSFLLRRRLGLQVVEQDHLPVQGRLLRLEGVPAPAGIPVLDPHTGDVR